MKNLLMLVVLVLLVLAVNASDVMAEEEYQRYTGSGAVDLLVYPGSAKGLHKNAAGFELRIHLSAAASGGTLLVDVGSAAGDAYGCNLETFSMSGTTDYARTFDNRIKASDTVRIRWENAGGVTYGIEIVWY